MAQWIRSPFWRLILPFVLPAGLAVAGVWLATRGGYVLAPLGALVFGFASALTVVEWRRQRLGRRDRDGPGMIELSEGVLRYWAADEMGAEIPLRHVNELRLITVHGRAYWRLRSDDNQALLIPVDALGSEVLADAFSALPGVDMGALVQARMMVGQPDFPSMQTLWRRPQ